MRSVSLEAELQQASPQQEQQQEADAAKMMQLLLTNHTILKSFLAMFLWPLISGVLFAADAQYSSQTASAAAALISFGACDSSRLIRCQQDMLQDLQLQLAGLKSPFAQHAISIGPPYSPRQAALTLSQQQQQSNNATLCRFVRANLDCILSLTPACYEQAASSSSGQLTVVQSGVDLMLRAKRHLEQSGCNEPDSSWTNTFCYRSHEVRACEERHGFAGSYQQFVVVNASACLAYQAFRQCVDSYSRLQCKVHEMDMLNEYLLDRAADLAWRCPAHNVSTTSADLVGSSISSYTDPYRLSNGHGYHPQSLVPTYGSSSGGGYHEGQRQIMPTYAGSQSGLSLFGSQGGLRDQAWERFRNPNLDEARYGISRLPGSGSGSVAGEVFDFLNTFFNNNIESNKNFKDRLIAGELDSSDCPVKAAPYARECEDTLLDQQRMARDSRDGNELQRRICCSLFQYRDCISRVVLDRCADSTQAAVETLMGVRRREMTLTCRGFNRDICSGSQPMVLLNRALLFLAAILTSFMTFKQRSSAHQF